MWETQVKRLYLAPHSARRLQHRDFFVVLTRSCLPRLGSGWSNALHLLGKLQDEARKEWNLAALLSWDYMSDFVQPSTPFKLYVFLSVGPPSFEEAESSLPVHCIHRVKSTYDRELESFLKDWSCFENLLSLPCLTHLFPCPWQRTTQPQQSQAPNTSLPSWPKQCFRHWPIPV